MHLTLSAKDNQALALISSFAQNLQDVIHFLSPSSHQAIKSFKKRSFIANRGCHPPAKDQLIFYMNI